MNNIIINNIDEITDINSFVDSIKKDKDINGLYISDINCLSKKNREKTVDILRAFKFIHSKKDTALITSYKLQDLLLENDEDIKSMMIYLNYLTNKPAETWINIQESMRQGKIILEKDILERKKN